MGCKKDYEDWQLIEWLKEYAEEIGRTPKKEDVEYDESMPSSGTYQKRFGTWNKALKKANLKINKIGRSYTRKEAVESLKEGYEILGRVPNSKDCRKLDALLSYNVYERIFGDYQIAVKEVLGLNINCKRGKNYGKKELLKLLRDFCKKLGRPPKVREIDDNENMPSYSIYLYHFGGMKHSIKKAKEMDL